MDYHELITTVLGDFNLLNIVEITYDTKRTKEVGPYFFIHPSHKPKLCVPSNIVATLSEKNRIVNQKTIEDLGYEFTDETYELKVLLHEIGHAVDFVKEYNQDYHKYIDVRRDAIYGLHSFIENACLSSSRLSDAVIMQHAYFQIGHEYYAEEFAKKHFEKYYDMFIRKEEKEVA